VVVIDTSKQSSDVTTVSFTCVGYVSVLDVSHDARHELFLQHELCTGDWSAHDSAREVVAVRDAIDDDWKKGVGRSPSMIKMKVTDLVEYTSDEEVL
jgi:hypothetical protein